MAVDNNGTAIEEVGDYLTLPLDNKRNVQVLVNAAIENGIYVIIDDHAHAAERDTQATVAAADPIDDGNVAYTLHFYAASHGMTCAIERLPR